MKDTGNIETIRMEELGLSKTHRQEQDTPTISDTCRLEKSDNETQNDVIDKHNQD